MKPIVGAIGFGTLWAAALVGGCQPPAGPVLARWELPAEARASRFREDGEGPFPEEWPVTALVVRQWEGHTPFLANAALHFVAGRGIRPDMSLEQLLPQTRVARPCSAAMTGRWLYYRKSGAALFVFVSDSGGTAGPYVEVFRHGVIYSDTRDPASFQDHRFDPVLQTNSRLPVCLGDVNGDGEWELLVATEATNGSGAFTPKAYRVIGLSGGEARDIGTLPWSDARKRRDLTCLEPGKAETPFDPRDFSDKP